jgi:hypothetical protein
MGNGCLNKGFVFLGRTSEQHQHPASAASSNIIILLRSSQKHFQHKNWSRWYKYGSFRFFCRHRFPPAGSGSLTIFMNQQAQRQDHAWHLSSSSRQAHLVLQTRAFAQSAPKSTLRLFSAFPLTPSTFLKVIALKWLNSADGSRMLLSLLVPCADSLGRFACQRQAFHQYTPSGHIHCFATMLGYRMAAYLKTSEEMIQFSSFLSLPGMAMIR